jgi:ADP-heptose:LPS heptosyltransferase
VRIGLRMTGAFGDVLASTPVVARLRQENPDAEIIVETEHPHAYHNNLHVTGTCSHLPPVDRFIDLNPSYRLWPHEHIVDGYFRVAFGDTEGDKTIVFKGANPSRITGEFIAVHPNVSWPNRTLAPEWWGKLVGQLREGGWPVLSLGTSIDHDLSNWGATDMRGKLTPAEQASAIAAAKAFVCFSSGLLVMAGATETPIVAMSTITRPELDLHYRHGSIWWNTTAIRAPVPCFGCRETLPPATYIDCKFGHNDCIRSFDAREVAETTFHAIENDERH